MDNSEDQRWKWFNFFGRLCGFVFLFGGVIIAYVGYALLREKPPHPDALLTIGAGAFFAVAGVLLLVARPHG